MLEIIKRNVRGKTEWGPVGDGGERKETAVKCKTKMILQEPNIYSSGAK